MVPSDDPTKVDFPQIFIRQIRIIKSALETIFEGYTKLISSIWDQLRDLLNEASGVNDHLSVLSLQLEAKRKLRTSGQRARRNRSAKPANRPRIRSPTFDVTDESAYL
jgi:hypothetical protein